MNGLREAVQIPQTPAATVKLTTDRDTCSIFVILKPIPPLNPYHPNHRIRIPVIIIGIFPCFI